MLKTCTKLPALLALAVIAASPAMAKETRSAQSVTSPGRSNSSEVAQERLALVFEVSAGTCDAPGNGNKYGHEKGRGQGHEIGRGKGHACDGQSPG